MKISELIEELEELKEEHGDLKVGVWDDEGMVFTPIMEIYKTNEGDFLDPDTDPDKWLAIRSF